MFIILAMAGIAIIFSGCMMIHEQPKPTTTSSTTTTTLPATNFLGVSLGDSTNEVISVLGQPGSIYYQDVYLVYDYYPVERRVLFEEPSEEVVAVVSSKGNDELNGIRPDMSAAQVRDLLGNPDRVKTGSIFYLWLYDRDNIMASFYIDDDDGYNVGIYSPGKIDPQPD